MRKDELHSSDVPQHQLDPPGKFHLLGLTRRPACLLEGEALEFLLVGESFDADAEGDAPDGGDGPAAWAERLSKFRAATGEAAGAEAAVGVLAVEV
mmetsp:Transcript_14057/g.30519  ORF Transcript_14057/g.30519 Transcript_14057/m.30519 type:complete len:96 (+) Transcript_14057:149-436(+)